MKVLKTIITYNDCGPPLFGKKTVQSYVITLLWINDKSKSDGEMWY